MGKSKARRPAPAIQPPAVATVPAVPTGVVDHGPGRFPWWRLALGVMGIVLLFGIWWCGVRPLLLVREARAKLETDPAAAAGLLEDAMAASWTSQRDAHVLWARALVRSGQEEEALGCFSLIQSPELAQADGLVDLADDALQARMALLAKLSLEAIPPTSTRRSDAIERLIAIQMLYENSDAALKLTDEWTQLQPKNAAPWMAKAQIHQQRLQFTEAKQDYREFLAREKQPEPRSVGLRSLVSLLILMGEREETREWQNELLQTWTTPTTEDQLHEAQLRRLEGDIPGAWSEVEQVLLAESGNRVALELRGTLAIDRHDYARAEADLATILKDQPWNKAVHYKLAQTLAKLGREAESASHFAENRRLNQLSTRVIDLQARKDRTAAETAELIEAMEQTGMQSAAERLKRSTP